MKKPIAVLAFALITLACAFCLFKTRAAEAGSFQKYEYVTIRWAGRDNTHLIRSNGKVEMLGMILNKVPRPDRTDERAFYMNIAMNSVAREGYEFAGMTTDEIIMKRALQP
ncbi:MAG: hypothetical protein ACTHLW_04745 [Verrucomicrobiota bacterium]